MAFDDLPPDFPDRPLTGATFVADVLDLVVPEEDRYRGALAVLVCDEADRMLAPFVVSEMPEDLPQGEREHVLTTVLAATEGRGSVLVAVARAHGLSLRDSDHAWARTAAEACSVGPRLLGVHVVTLDGSREVPVAAVLPGGL